MGSGAHAALAGYARLANDHRCSPHLFGLGNDACFERSPSISVLCRFDQPCLSNSQLPGLKPLVLELS